MKNKILRKAAVSMGLVLCTVTTAVATAHATTVQWYADNLEAARQKQAECMRRLKAGERLSEYDMKTCQNANSALLRQGKFEKSSGKRW